MIFLNLYGKEIKNSVYVKLLKFVYSIQFYIKTRCNFLILFQKESEFFKKIIKVLAAFMQILFNINFINILNIELMMQIIIWYQNNQ